jgi:hypothetical protein
MEELQTSYEAKRATYDALVAANDPTKLPEIQRLNGELAELLTRMAEILASTKDSARDITVYRDALLQQLVGIQNDASILKEQRDQYTTLHMLQTHDDAVFRSSFFWYALALGIAALMFFILLLRSGGYKLPTMPAAMSNPNTMPALT